MTRTSVSSQVLALLPQNILPKCLSKEVEAPQGKDKGKGKGKGKASDTTISQSK